MPNHTDSTSKEIRLRAFDFLRGLAIFAVILVHTSQSFPTNISLVDSLSGLGQFRVQLFYFISALTMCYTWKLREGELNPIRNFYIRRFFRIAPLFWIAIPVYLFINGLDKGYWAPEGIGIVQIFLTATFLHGFWPDAINSVVPGGWSIAVEMTFYALFPLLILKVKERSGLYLFLAIIVWILNILIFKDVASNFFVNHYDTSSTTIINDYLYLNFINQAPVFLLGCYLYFSLRDRPTKLEVLSLCVWIAFSASLKFFLNVAGFGFLSVTLTLGLFVYFSVRSNLRFKSVETLGKNSYAIYLVHFFVLYILKKMMPIHSGVLAWLIAIALTTLLSYVLALIVYVIIETRVHRFVQAITQPKLSQ